MSERRHPVAADGFAHDVGERRRAHRRFDLQRGERAREPGHMAGLIDKPAVAYLADLIDRVGELKAAVFHVDGGFGVRQIAAVDVDDAGHGALAP
jgi:hypothetical protein